MRNSHLVIFAGLVLVGVSYVAYIAGESHTSSPQAHLETIAEKSSAPADPDVSPVSSPPALHDPKPVTPSLTGLTVHPYQLLKNPYKEKGKLVFLDLDTRPVLYGGTFVQYSGAINPTVGTQYGLMALKLNRMIAEDTALYDIMGVEAGNSQGEMVGQLAVSLPPGITDLSLDRSWVVEPQGTLTGTNGFGAEISIPSVRFWHYGLRNEMPSQGEQTPSPQHQAEIPSEEQQQHTQMQSGGIIGTFKTSPQ